MGAALTIVDQSASGRTLRSFTLQLASERLTVRELIRRRVQHEVEEYNRSATQPYQGLVQPTFAEVALNGARTGKRRTVDAEQQLAVALDAFQRNGFFLLVDDRQVESLDEELVLRKDTRVSFIKLVPLVGG